MYKCDVSHLKTMRKPIVALLAAVVGRCASVGLAVVAAAAGCIFLGFGGQRETLARWHIHSFSSCLIIIAYKFYSLIRHLPVISLGCCKPMMRRTEGATSAKMPSCTVAFLFAVT